MLSHVMSVADQRQILNKGVQAIQVHTWECPCFESGVVTIHHETKPK